MDGAGCRAGWGKAGVVEQSRRWNVRRRSRGRSERTGSLHDVSLGSQTLFEYLIDERIRWGRRLAEPAESIPSARRPRPALDQSFAGISQVGHYVRDRQQVQTQDISSRLMIR